jgi:YVTN family beta-propeller protein
MRRLVPLLAAVALGAGCGGASKTSAPAAHPTTPHASSVKAVVRPKPLRLVAAGDGKLPAPVQDGAAARDGAGAVYVGGLTSADVSTSDILRVARAGGVRIGSLPHALHDTAAVTIGGATYAFGGGDLGQYDPIVRVDPGTGATADVARLPAPSSDQAATAVDGTAYVVGGYTGSRWLDTIVAWRPGGTARVVGHLPTAVRYAAVTSVDGRVVVAGGSLPDGTATNAVYSFDPATRAVTRLARLPVPTTHAAAAAIGSTIFVIGGRSATLNTPKSSIVAIDLPTGRVRKAGSLPQALSDLAAVATKNGILVVGGHAVGGTVDTITELRPTTAAPVPARHAARERLASVPPLVNAHDVYAADAAGNLSPVVRDAKPYVYVPNSDSDTVDVIDQRTFKIVDHFAVGGLPQHVVPSWDLKTLYVTNDTGNSLTAIDPNTGQPTRTIPVDDPYNMYFTPDGRYAIVVAERLHRLDFRDAHTFALHKSIAVPCAGVDHMDFSADGSYAIASCEFSGQLLKVDIPHERVVGVLTLPHAGAAPQDVKLSPNGEVFYVADMNSNGVWLVHGSPLRVVGFIHTGAGAHGLYPSRDSKYLYITNRGEGSISVLSFRTRKLVAKWQIPGGGSPDMGNVSADGKVLWLSGRYNSEVYAISTSDGRLLARIPVGAGPHGLCVWPQPGRYSLGHTGILR